MCSRNRIALFLLPWMVSSCGAESLSENGADAATRPETQERTSAEMGLALDPGGCIALWSPSWQQGTGANEWWVEYYVGAADVQSVSLEIPGMGSVPLSPYWGKWVGGTSFSIPAGTWVTVLARSSSGLETHTTLFRYLIDLSPPTDPCAGSCTPAWNPSWQQESGANEWWVELAISGSIAAAHLEVLGQGDIPLTYRWNKWVGATSFRVAAGTRVVAHAEDRAGQHARTRSFSYLVETRPLTDECAAGCRQSCRGYLLRELAILGGAVTRVHDLNDDLDAVGEADTPSGQRRAVLFRGNTIHDLGTLGGPNSVAYSIDAHGRVVGAAQTPSSNWHAFVWEERGPGTAVMIDLGTLKTGMESFAYGINDRGQIVGQSDVLGSPNPYGGIYEVHAVLWEPQGDGYVIRDLGRLGGMAGRGVAINQDGGVAGNAYHAGGSGKIYSTATLWSQGITTPLETSDYVWTAKAISIDDHGIVVGGTAPLSGGGQAVAWYARTATVLGSLAGLPSSAAYDINHAGLIVGTVDFYANLSNYRWSDVFRGTVAVLWQRGVAVDLNERVIDRGDWRLEVARAINRDGVIAGWGAHEGETRSFLLIPTSTPRLGVSEDPSAE